jgi:hypothetical protein
VRIVSDPREDPSLVTPIRGVFALQIVQRGDTLVGRIVGHDDDDEGKVPETHLPPLPEVIEAPSPPYRRLFTDAPR